MTNEEAKKNLLAYAYYVDEPMPPDVAKAFDMAIKALEQPEPCEDAISRQAAIDAMAELQGRASTKAELKGISKAWKRIKQLPSAQPEQRWIPVGERLPDTNRDVLLQFSTSMGVGFWENGEWGVNTGDNIYSEIGEGEAQPIAWCELPEQYQGGGKQKRGEQE